MKTKHLVLACLLILPMTLAPTLAAQASAITAVRKPVSIPDARKFPILVWTSPGHLAKYWKWLGCNALVCGEKYEGEEQRLAFLDTLKKEGLYGVLSLTEFSKKLDAHPALLYWRLEDEPDQAKSFSPLGYKARTAPATLAKEIAKVKGRKKPIWLNTTARFYRPYRRISVDTYRKFYRLADIVGFDHYPVTGWNAPEKIGELELATRACQKLAPGKPVITIVEASDQNLSWTPKETRGPNPLEMRAEVWLSLVGGARGIGYFPIAFDPFRWKALGKGIAAEMKTTNVVLARHAEFLSQGPGKGLLFELKGDAIRIGYRTLRDEGTGRVRFFLFAVNRSHKHARALVHFRVPKAKGRLMIKELGAPDATYWPKPIRVLELEALGLRFFEGYWDKA